MELWKNCPSGAIVLTQVRKNGLCHVNMPAGESVREQSVDCFFFAFRTTNIPI